MNSILLIINLALSSYTSAACDVSNEEFSNQVKYVFDNLSGDKKITEYISGSILREGKYETERLLPHLLLLRYDWNEGDSGVIIFGIDPSNRSYNMTSSSIESRMLSSVRRGCFDKVKSSIDFDFDEKFRTTLVFSKSATFDVRFYEKSADDKWVLLPGYQNFTGE